MLQKESGNSVSVCFYVLGQLVLLLSICMIKVKRIPMFGTMLQITYYSAEIIASMIIDNRIVMVLLKRSGLVLYRIT